MTCERKTTDGHPPREGREDGERCDGKCGCHPKRLDGSAITWMCCLGCRKPDAPKECAFCSGDDSKPFQDHCTCPAHGAAKGEEESKDKLEERRIQEMAMTFALRFRNTVEGGNSSTVLTDRAIRLTKEDIESLVRDVRDEAATVNRDFYIDVITKERSRSEKVGEARAWKERWIWCWGCGEKTAIAFGEWEGEKRPQHQEANKGILWRSIRCEKPGCQGISNERSDNSKNFIQAAKDDGHQVG